jgi:uncharacterized membrane protein YqjE
MPSAPSGPTGFVDSFRVLGASLLGSLEDRLELFSVELQEEKFRLIQLFVWISAAIFTGIMAIAFASLTLVYLFWESARLAVLGGITVAYTAAFVAMIVACRRFIARQPKPFAATRQEIGEDRTCIRSKN